METLGFKVMRSYKQNSVALTSHSEAPKEKEQAKAKEKGVSKEKDIGIVIGTNINTNDMYETNLTPEGHEFYVGMLTDWLGDTLGDWQATQIIVQEHFDHSLALREKAIEEIRHVKDDPIQPLSMLFEGIVHPPQENGLQHFN